MPNFGRKLRKLPNVCTNLQLKLAVIAYSVIYGSTKVRGTGIALIA